MKRRTLDIVFSAGGLGVAVLVLVLGLVMTSNASFAKTYVRNQLIEQKVSFKPANTLTAEEKKSACVVKYAGQALTNGKQAECYANEFIALHLKSIPGATGQTYAQLGDTQTQLKAQIADAQKKNDPSVAGLQKQLTDVSTARETVFKGETLRGLLLTSYGFSVLGAKGGQAATVAFLVAGLMTLLSLAGFAHAFRTSGTEGFAVPDRPKMRKRPLRARKMNDEREPARV
ncbi:MAG: hypothetical protein JWP02_2494 [Acidimicrobiales bacterium]|nr:hypothetical protein [Acidimicrobiales bacterium]